jgi:1-deoxy-D-xylulose-5-phosphate reductoisomerase
MTAKRKIAILGASGSIGMNAIRVIRAHRDSLELVAIAGGSRIQPLVDIAREVNVREVAVFDPQSLTPAELKNAFPGETNISTGMEGLIRVATLEEVDMVLIAVVGTTTLRPCIEAIRSQKMIALASKEILVMAGEFIMPILKENKGILLPTDSEHNAIFQCLNGENRREVEKIILTASGGRYLNTPIDELASITPEDAVKHPNWDMGQKISIDSSTMANKGLEVIEAKWLFGVEPEQIEVVIHPQSIIHSMMQFVDGSILAQMSPPNMSFAIQNCLLYPERKKGIDPTLDFHNPFALDFQAPDHKRFPCLQLAFDALHTARTAPAIYNAANEVAVGAFIENRISYLDIPRVIEFTLSRMNILQPSSIEDVIQADKEAREISQNWTLS